MEETVQLDLSTLNKSYLTEDFPSNWYSKILLWVEDHGIAEINGLDMGLLDIDEAYVIGKTYGSAVGLYSLSEDCYKCPFELEQKISENVLNWTVSTSRRIIWRLYQLQSGAYESKRYISPTSSKDLICELKPNFGEFGVYQLDVVSTGCRITVLQEPVNIYYPLLFLFLLLSGMVLLYALLRYIIHQMLLKEHEEDNPVEPISVLIRYRCVDAFRGLAVLLMIFVEDGAGGYWWLGRSTWNGLLPGDLIAPAFVFAMGISIPLAIKKARDKQISKWRIALKILRRTGTLFLLGIFVNTINGCNDLAYLEFWGVLQRLAVAYGISALFYLFTSKHKCCDGSFFSDFFDSIWCLLLVTALIALQTTLSFTFKQPGCPKGYNGPGGKQNNWTEANCTGGITRYIEQVTLGSYSRRSKSTLQQVYDAVPFDEPVIFGSIMTTVQTILGIHTGTIMVFHKRNQSRVLRWLAWAVMFGACSGMLCQFSKEDGLIPVNRSLWSLSFVLATTSICLLALTFLYVLMEILQLMEKSSLRALGVNSLIIYIGNLLFSNTLPFNWTLLRMRTHTLVLIENVWTVAMWIIVANLLLRKKIVIKI